MVEAGASDEVGEALEALNVARGRFVAVVGHELRTPVTTLRGLAEELVDADLDTVREVVPGLVRSARRVEALLDDLLLATDITTALPVGDPEPIDIVATAQATWDALGAEDDLELTGELELTVVMRPGAADTLLERVLDNARRYGSAPYQFHAGEAPGSMARIIVSSEGAELQPDDVHLAFELFYRGEAAVTSAPGFGLGLTVARALARHDGGDLTIEPRPSGGLDVCIDLPLAR